MQIHRIIPSELTQYSCHLVGGKKNYNCSYFIDYISITSELLLLVNYIYLNQYEFNLIIFYLYILLY